MSYYGTPSGFRTYHTARGRPMTEYDDDTALEALLLVASEWSDGTYGGQFPGIKTGGRDQARMWPRAGAYDKFGYAIPSDSVPVEQISAVYEAAYKEGETSGALLRDYTPSQYKRVSVDGAVSVEYAQFQSAFDAQTRFPVVDHIIAPLLTGAAVSSLSGSVSRV